MCCAMWLLPLLSEGFIGEKRLEEKKGKMSENSHTRLTLFGSGHKQGRGVWSIYKLRQHGHKATNQATFLFLFYLFIYFSMAICTFQQLILNMKDGGATRSSHGHSHLTFEFLLFMCAKVFTIIRNLHWRIYFLLNFFFS